MISSRQLPSGVISGSKLAINSVGAGQLQSGSVGSLQVKMAAIQTAHIQNAAITKAKIAEATIGELNATAITAISAKIQELAAKNITTDELYAALATIAVAQMRDFSEMLRQTCFIVYIPAKASEERVHEIHTHFGLVICGTCKFHDP